jgi:hypothetical protein
MSVSRMERYLEDHYAQQVRTPKEFERGANGFTPSCSVLGHLESSYANEGLDAIMYAIFWLW